jgi:CRISPR-associated protein Csb1
VTDTLTQYDTLIETVDWLMQREKPVAITLTEILEPSGGPSAIIFPPTYARRGGEHPYVIDVLRTDMSPEAAGDKAEVNICQLDSVGSQANRMEPCFAQGPFKNLVPPRAIICDNGQKVNLLEVGHRIADGAVRFSSLADDAKQAIGALRESSDAQKIARLAPTSLVFGFWDSRDSLYRSPRILSSTIHATNVAPLKRSAQFNPAFDVATIGLTGEAEGEVALAQEEKDPLSQEGLRAAPAVDTHGGVRVYGKIVRQTEINLVNLRALAVPSVEGINEADTLKLRRYIFGLCLIAGRAQLNYNLRQGCLLVLKAGTQPVAQLVYPSGERRPFTWDLKAALEFTESAARDFGVADGGEYHFDKAKVEARLKEKEQEKTEKKARKKATRS